MKSSWEPKAVLVPVQVPVLVPVLVPWTCPIISATSAPVVHCSPHPFRMQAPNSGHYWPSCHENDTNFPWHHHIRNAEVLKHRRQHTHSEGSATGLPVDVLVAQVEDQREGAVQEGKHPHAHKELCRGAEVTLQVPGLHLAAVARW